MYTICRYIFDYKHVFFLSTLSLESAQKAKANVMKEYMIVGCTDDMRGFFQVLEYLLPSYFRNSVRVYDYYRKYIQGTPNIMHT